ncbi:Protein FAR1-RELATED SEQUENCE 11 [Quillaja saponaria]|uniref:Protein FAR1-RELATED SEQUENCE n=1 Tax=Quillaja saponaria TaxID=32244 RepID=A0AAD7KV88_QUISA|nr:Protein FAR1-RELATED SEQUENCE 11 [Quillaja saponaria]
MFFFLIWVLMISFFLYQIFEFLAVQTQYFSRSFRYEDDIEETSSASEWAKTEKAPSETMVTPYVGMVFKSEQDPFEYHVKFARKNGFSIFLKRSRVNPHLGLYKREFVCYRSGFTQVKKKPTGEHHRDSISVKCDCDAKMYVAKEVVDGVSLWIVWQFSNIHNHELLEDDQLHLLPTDQERILLLSTAGFSISRIVKMLEQDNGSQGGQLPFLETAILNFVKNSKKVQENDAKLTAKRDTDTSDLLEASKDGDPEFLYDFTVVENDEVENIAWSYSESVHAYNQSHTDCFLEHGLALTTMVELFSLVVSCCKMKHLEPSHGLYRLLFVS